MAAMIYKLKAQQWVAAIIATTTKGRVIGVLLKIPGTELNKVEKRKMCVWGGGGRKEKSLILHSSSKLTAAQSERREGEYFC